MHDDFGNGMFPTHVGIARRTRTCGCWIRHVPYACGDCAGVGCPCGCPCECSLRMWGLRARGRHVLRTVAMFPTHVGIARLFTARATACTNVPYACGDCASPRAPSSSGRPCSLRMWGLRGPRHRASAGGAMFPTHVGIARHPVRDGAGAPYVPYACGDCAGM